MTTQSQNGYPANDVTLTQVWTIGAGRLVRLKKGACGEVLKHFADWFDTHIEDLDAVADDWGYAERNIRGSETVVSNHASGTALDLNATRHPLGKRGTFTTKQTAAIRKQLEVYEGAIRWGGDYQNRADEMHFEIDAPLSHVSAVARKLRGAPVPTYVSRVRAALLKVLNGPDAAAISPKRTAVRALLVSIRALVNRLPKE